MLLTRVWSYAGGFAREFSHDRLFVVSPREESHARNYRTAATKGALGMTEYGRGVVADFITLRTPFPGRNMKVPATRRRGEERVPPRPVGR